MRKLHVILIPSWLIEDLFVCCHNYTRRNEIGNDDKIENTFFRAAASSLYYLPQKSISLFRPKQNIYLCHLCVCAPYNWIIEGPSIYFTEYICDLAIFSKKFKSGARKCTSNYWNNEDSKISASSIVLKWLCFCFSESNLLISLIITSLLCVFLLTQPPAPLMC